MFILLLTQALAADDPCYGHGPEARASSEHFWVEWVPGSIEDREGEIILNAAESAREVWLDMGYGFPDEPVRIDLVAATTGGVSGLTTTQDCAGRPVPFIQLFFTDWDRRSVIDVVTHETAHAAQYADMGSFSDAVGAWLWWMEGHATWMTPRADDQWRSWSYAVNFYTASLGLPLQHGLEGFQDPTTQMHMYGTAWLVQALSEYAGDDAVRETWRWGGANLSAPIYFPDAIAGIGVDFDAFWAFYLSTLPTLALDHNNGITPPSATSALPDDQGELTVDGQLGAAIVHVASSYARGGSLDVTVSGDDAGWSVILLRTHDGTVVDYVPLTIEGGQGSGWIVDFDDVDAWIVASPTRGDGPHTLQWTTAAGSHGRPMDGQVLVDETYETRGCSSTPGVAGLAAALGAWALRRRRHPSRSQRAAVVA